MKPTFSYDDLEAESKTDYIKKLKDQFNELHGIELEDHEIQDIQEREIQDEKKSNY